MDKWLLDFQQVCNPDRPGFNFGAARAALPDADVSTATDSRIPSNNARIAQGDLSSPFPLLPEGGVAPDGRAQLAAVPHLSERSCGAAGFTVLLKRTALTEEKRRPFWDPETPCFWTPLPRKYKLLRAGLVLRSVTTGESPVLYVFGQFSSFIFAPDGVELACPRDAQPRNACGRATDTLPPADRVVTDMMQNARNGTSLVKKARLAETSKAGGKEQGSQNGSWKGCHIMQFLTRSHREMCCFSVFVSVINAAI